MCLFCELRRSIWSPPNAKRMPKPRNLSHKDAEALREKHRSTQKRLCPPQMWGNHLGHFIQKGDVNQRRNRIFLRSSIMASQEKMSQYIEDAVSKLLGGIAGTTHARRSHITPSCVHFAVSRSHATPASQGEQKQNRLKSSLYTGLESGVFKEVLLGRRTLSEGDAHLLRCVDNKVRPSRACIQ